MLTGVAAAAAVLVIPKGLLAAAVAGVCPKLNAFAPPELLLGAAEPKVGGAAVPWPPPKPNTDAGAAAVVDDVVGAATAPPKPNTAGAADVVDATVVVAAETDPAPPKANWLGAVLVAVAPLPPNENEGAAFEVASLPGVAAAPNGVLAASPNENVGFAAEEVVVVTPTAGLAAAPNAKDGGGIADVVVAIGAAAAPNEKLGPGVVDVLVVAVAPKASAAVVAAAAAPPNEKEAPLGAVAILGAEVPPKENDGAGVAEEVVVVVAAAGVPNAKLGAAAVVTAGASVLVVEPKAKAFPVEAAAVVFVLPKSNVDDGAEMVVAAEAAAFPKEKDGAVVANVAAATEVAGTVLPAVKLKEGASEVAVVEVGAGAAPNAKGAVVDIGGLVKAEIVAVGGFEVGVLPKEKLAVAGNAEVAVTVVVAAASPKENESPPEVDVGAAVVVEVLAVVVDPNENEGLEMVDAVAMVVLLAALLPNEN